MTQTSAKLPARGLLILKTTLYILSGLVLVLGLILGISLMSGASSVVANLLLPLQLIGGEVASSLISPVLSGFLINLGVVTIILALVLSALLYTAGRLVGHIVRLEERLTRLETGG
jgi:hypothetical protein